MQIRASWLIGGGVAAVAVVLFFVSGTATGADQALQVMGFDPDRSNLLTALISTGIAATIIALFGAPTALGVLAGLVAGGVAFAGTAIRETRAALAAHGAQGTFDPVGWVISIATFVVAFAVTAWAAAILAREVRERVAAAVQALREVARGSIRGRRQARLVGAIGVLVSVAVVVVALPVFGDMINFDPDVHMRQGAPGLPGVALGSPDPSVSPATAGTAAAPGRTGASARPGTTTRPIASAASPSGAAASPDASGASGGTSGTAGAGTSTGGFPSGLVAGPLPSSLITPGVVSTATPWSSTVPSGSGRVTTASLPGPWTGGVSGNIGIDIYLPPGYDAGSQRYPVIYQAPQSIATWQGGMQLTSVLDNLINTGAIPPVIVVFVSQYGGPYPDSECADSYDGHEWFDRFVATDLVTYIDGHFRTIATAAARATLGFSTGGYCAGAFVAHHPDVFSSAMILSGYYVSGVHSGTTPNAWRPFNDNPTIVAATSPMTVIPQVQAPLRSGLFYVMAADPTNGFYGPQLIQFSNVLSTAGVPMAILPTPLGHSWDAARQLLPTMLEMVAGRMVDQGVFGPAH